MIFRKLHVFAPTIIIMSSKHHKADRDMSLQVEGKQTIKVKVSRWVQILDWTFLTCNLNFSMEKLRSFKYL